MKWFDGLRRYAELSDILRPHIPLSRFVPLVEDFDPQQVQQSVDPDGAGYVCCGMRSRLNAAKYMAFVCIFVDAHVTSPRLVLDAVMWQGNNARTVGEKTFALTENRKRLVLIPLNFELADPGTIEVRVWSDVNAQLFTTKRIGICRTNDVPLERQIAFAAANSPVRPVRRPSAKALDVFAAAEIADVVLWLSNEAMTEDVFVHPEGEATPFLPLQIVGIGAAAPFRLADGRVLLPLPWLWENGRDRAAALALTAGRTKKIVTLPRSHAISKNTPPTKTNGAAWNQESTVSDIANVPQAVSPATARSSELQLGPPASIKVRSTGAADQRASGNAVRLRLWSLDEALTLGDLNLSDTTGELLDAPVVLTKNSDMDLLPARSAALIFDCGPDCGIAEIQQGKAICHANLFSPFPGAFAVFIPQDLSSNRASIVEAFDADREPSSSASLGVIALGRKNLLSRGVEVGIAALWYDYPVKLLRYTQAKFAGDVDYREDAVVLERGLGSFPAGEVPGIELWKHDWGGICAVAYQGRILIIDLYAPKRERLLLLPSLPDCLLSTQSQRPFEMGDVVHPALKHIFRRMRANGPG